jgi:hypothetical protein
MTSCIHSTDPCATRFIVFVFLYKRTNQCLCKSTLTCTALLFSYQLLFSYCMLLGWVDFFQFASVTYFFAYVSNSLSLRHYIFLPFVFMVHIVRDTI